MKIIYFLGLLLLLNVTQAAHAQSDDPELRSDRPESYTVVTGDTLWDISGRFLEDPWRWREIWQGNNQITNPDLIYPGDVIRLIFVDGKPQLTVNNPNTSPQLTSGLLPPEIKTTPTNPNKSLKTVKLSPKIYSTPIESSIPAIPLDKINKFLLKNRVVEAEALNLAPHIIAGQDKRVILSAGDFVYARGDFDGRKIDSYGIYRMGQEYIDPDTKEVLGTQALDIGSVNLLSVEGDIGTFAISRSTLEVRVGDRLLPNAERQITSTFLPIPPKNQVEGEIMAVERGVSQAGKLEILVVNLGDRDQMQRGDLLGIFKRGSKINDRFAQSKTPRSISLPDERAGLVMIFQTFEKMSLAIVLEAEKGVILGDIVRNP